MSNKECSICCENCGIERVLEIGFAESVEELNGQLDFLLRCAALSVAVRGSNTDAQTVAMAVYKGEIQELDPTVILRVTKDAGYPFEKVIVISDNNTACN